MGRIKHLVRTAAVLLAAAVCTSGTARAGTPAAWTTVERLQPGRPISITFRDGAEAVGWVITADESTLHYFRPARKQLSPNVTAVLDTTRDRWPKVLDGGTIEMNGVKLSVTGVYDGDRKVADHVTVTREDVRVISNPDHHTTAVTVLGVVGGMFFSGWVMVATHASEGLALLEFVGMSTAGGVGAYYLAKGRPIYEAPGQVMTTLDDATSRRIIAKLPPSLRGSGGTR